MRERDDMIKRTGVVTKIYGASYEITDDETQLKVLCTLNGKMKMNSIKLLIGDRVDFEVSTYDLTRGRVTFRKK